MQHYKKKLGKVTEINGSQIHDYLCAMLRGSVEKTLNAMLDAEADNSCNAQRDTNGLKLAQIPRGFFPLLHDRFGIKFISSTNEENVLIRKVYRSIIDYRLRTLLRGSL